MNSFNLVDGINKTELPVGFDQMPLTNNLDVCFYFIYLSIYFLKEIDCILRHRQEPKRLH